MISFRSKEKTTALSFSVHNRRAVGRTHPTPAAVGSSAVPREDIKCALLLSLFYFFNVNVFLCF